MSTNDEREKEVARVAEVLRYNTVWPEDYCWSLADKIVLPVAA